MNIPAKERKPAPVDRGEHPPDLRSMAVIGAGAWGTALAQTLCRAGRQVRLWAREPEVVQAVNERHENALFLPGVRLDERIAATADAAQALAGADAVMLVVPAQYMRAVCKTLAPHWPAAAPAVLCAKGFEVESGALMSVLAAEALPGSPVAVLSGPTFAAEVARGLPAAVTLACPDPELGRALVAAIGTPTFRPYLSDDVVGAQVGGAVKNVLAIACGIVAGRKLGDNARAAVVTRGLAEIMRLAEALGGRAETLMGLSGLGDLILTATSMQSRNFSLGAALGEGRSLEDVLGERRSVAEGVHTARALALMAARLGVDMPICAAVDAVLHQGVGVDETIDGLLARPFRTEADDRPLA